MGFLGGHFYSQVPDTGCLVIGENGTLSASLWNNDCSLMLKGDSKFNAAGNHDAAKVVPQTIPRAKGGHIQEWVESCLGGSATFSNFDIGGYITEIGLAGSVALRLVHDIDWDGERMEVKGVPDASALVKPNFRRKWIL